MVCFEFPIIERVRTFLRLEYLFDRLHSAINSDAEWAHHPSTNETTGPATGTTA